MQQIGRILFLSVSLEVRLNKGAWLGMWGRMSGHGMDFESMWYWLISNSDV